MTATEAARRNAARAMLVLARRGASRDHVRDAIVVAFMRGARLQARLDRAAVNVEATAPHYSGPERREYRGRTVR